MSKNSEKREAYADMATRLKDTVELLTKESGIGFAGREAGIKDAITLILMDVAYCDLMSEEESNEIPDEEWDRQAEVDSLRRLS